MRRFTIVLLGVAVAFVALAGSSALGQELEYRALFGELVMIDLPVGDPPFCNEAGGPGCYEIQPVSFTAGVNAPGEGVRRDVPCELTLIANPPGRAMLALRCPGLTVCSAHGPRAIIDREFQFGGPDDPDASFDLQVEVFNASFSGAPPSDPLPEGSPLAGEPSFACGTVGGEDVAVNCDGLELECTTDVTSHGFMHAHGFRGGNYIGPITVRFKHESNRGNYVQVQVKVPDGDIVISGSLAPEDAVYCEVDEFSEQQNCFSLE